MRITREVIYNALFNLIKANLTIIPIFDEPTTITEALQYTTVWWSRWVSDISVVSDTGQTFTNIGTGTPSPGEYVVSNGIYTFAEADIGTSIEVSYNFTGLVTFSRRLLFYGDVPEANQPAMYLALHSESEEKQRGLPSKWTLFYDLYVYVNTGNDDTVVPAQMMNPILDQVSRMFKPNDLSNYAQTLGGLVSHAALNGQTQTDEGTLGSQAYVIIPIEILVPTFGG